MVKIEPISINKTVKAYMKYGHEFGFCNAEFLLMKYAPGVDTRCYDIPIDKRGAFIKDIENEFLKAGLIFDLDN
jgi:hypothetical protein